MSAALAADHRERGEDRHGMRDVRTEIARAYSVQDRPTLPEAEAATRWLIGESGIIEAVGGQYDLADETTGEVLASGRAGAVLVGDDGVVLVVDWTHADAYDAPEPEDDLGLVAMGLAAAKGRSFRLATVALRGLEVFTRRSHVFEPDTHPALLARIRQAVSQPRDVACPGEWCGACRQAVHCDAWRARATTALTVFEAEAPLAEDGIPQLDLTDDTCGPLMERIKCVEKAIELAKDQVKAYVRRGGRCVVGGKSYQPFSSKGRESVDIKALKAAGHDEFVRTGEPFETFRWVKRS
jgi:hypothetical protein